MQGIDNGLFPVMLRLTGKRCVVIGGGEVAARKVQSLLDAGADCIVIISEEWSEPLVELGVELGDRIQVVRRRYQAGDIRDAALVISATNDREVNALVAAEAELLNIWVNTADDGATGTFLTPAVVRRGDLTIALTTGGASPALAARLKSELERTYGDDYAPRLHALRMLREYVLGDRTQKGSTSRTKQEVNECRSLLRAAAEDESGWRSVAEQLKTFSDPQYRHELYDSLDQWIDRLKRQLT